MISMVKIQGSLQLSCSKISHLLEFHGQNSRIAIRVPIQWNFLNHTSLSIFIEKPILKVMLRKPLVPRAMI